MTFRTALKILGQHDRPVLDRIDGLLGGVILAGGMLALTGPTAAPLVALAAGWGWVDQKNEATGLVRKLLDSVAGRRLGLASRERMELVAAAHTVLAASAVLEVFRERLGRAATRSMEKHAKGDTRVLVSGTRGSWGQSFLDWLYHVEVPIPSGGLGFHENLPLVQQWQLDVLERLRNFCFATDEQRADWPSSSALAEKAVNRYVSRYHELAAKVPEFMMWALLREGAATRSAVREAHEEVRAALDGNSMALSRLEALLAVLSSDVRRERRGLSETVRQSAVSALDDPIVARGGAALSHGQEIVFPLVHEIYVEPHYRLATYERDTPVCDERWWDEQRVADDLNLMLAAHFASPESTRLPLLLLGHPGAGKSLLTKVLAARLPTASYTTIRVPLRHVTADAPIFRQVQQALDQATNGRVEWHALSDQTADITRVILLDGLDELLQASAQNRTAFLHEVAEFQRTEAAMNRPVAVVVTSRTVVADRVDIPTGTTVVKLDDFDHGQIEHWRHVWNRTNARGVAAGAVRALSAEAVAASGVLSGQPLLLLMVALYAADPSLPPIDTNLSHTTLYQRLLENFALRESAKSTTPQGEDPAETVREQLRRLSVAALGMFNRGRQDVTDVELGDDLAAFDLTTPGTTRDTEAARELTTQFFFIYTAQSLMGNDQTYRSYEFLHATLGEYLVAREVVETLCDTVVTTVSRRGGPKDPDDALLFALLSHQCLATRRSILTFAAEILDDLDEDDRAGIRRVLDTVISRCRRRHGSEKYKRYRPTNNDTVDSIAVYSANLFLLRVLNVDSVALTEIWPSGEQTAWRSTLSLWRSGLAADAWNAMMGALTRRGDDIVFGSLHGMSPLAAFTLQEAALADDIEHLRLLEMGVAIRYNPDYLIFNKFTANEQLDRWLLQAVFLAIPEIQLDRLRSMLAGIGRERSYRVKALNMLLKQRNHLLSYEFIRVIVEALEGPFTDQYAMMAAIVAQPQLLDDVPSLADPDRYAHSPGIGLVMASARDKRARFAQLDKLFAGIEHRWRDAEHDTADMARALVDGYRITSRDT